jgi:lycopene beta-cyclase
MTPTSVRLADQTVLTAGCVIDGRGPQANPALALGFQKFIGREVETAEPHGRRWPVIMDATVDQRDGYRFVYTLPLDERRLLIEDTYYSDGHALDPVQLSDHIDAYAAAQGWRIVRDIRAEQGVLPIVLAGDMRQFWADDGVPRLGLRAALFHPTTGYSLPDAVRAAEIIGTLPDLSAAAVRAAIERMVVDAWEAREFYRFLNRMLFLAAAGDERASVMERFYTMPEALVRRFYEGQLTFADKARIVIGRPPIAISRALPCLSTAPAWRFAARNGGQG